MIHGEYGLVSPGSESTACLEGFNVNVGDPDYSSRMKYRWTSIKARISRWWSGSQMGNSTDETD